MRVDVILGVCSVAVACGGSGSAALTEVDAARRVEGPRGISPWWASLFEEGATSSWRYTYHHHESELSEEGEWVEVVDVQRETQVLCVVSRVRREGAL